MRRHPTRALVRGLAVLAALVPALAATPAGAATDAEAEARPSWTDCSDGFQCATVTVPLDYDRPHGRRIELAMIRLPASNPAARIGSLFVNFGGPGASGVDRLRARAGWDWLFSPALKERFDLVSWDTRGVGRSTAIRCFDTKAEQQAFFASIVPFPVGAQQEQEFYAKADELAQRCKRLNPELIDHLSSANTARDLDVLRRAVGDAKLSYLGESYGTHVGATYANLFPHKVRALVLDGALDFAGNANGHGTDGFRLPIDTRQDVPRGMAETFGEFLRQCTAAGPKCAFSGGDPAAKWTALAARARQGPITTPDGTTWTYAAIVDNVSGSLTRPEFWADLGATLQAQYEAAVPGRRKAAAAAVRPHGEQYLDNRAEAFYAINCADSDVPRDPAVYSRLAVTEEQRVPYFGPIGVFDYMPCAFWQGHDRDRYVGPWNRRTAAPILVTNNRYDPATPLHGARDATAELARAGLVVVEGAGHTGMFVHSACGERLKREYLFTGALPPAGTTCPADDVPFP
jgi:pimeloyl-ACP methyl ester carboxylesterase